MKHISILDSLRAIAAISVCLYHFTCTTIGLEFSEITTSLFGFGKYGVHVFFVISGFIIPFAMYNANYKIKSFFKFIYKRLIRLEPPYLFSILLILVIAFIKTKFNIGVQNSEPITFTRFLLHFGYLINFFPEYKWLNNVYWTLAIEFQYYIIISFAFLLFISKKFILRLIAYLLFFLAGYLFFTFSIFNHFPIYAPLFLIGIISFLLNTKIINTIEFIGVISLCTIYNFIYLEPAIAVIGSVTSLIILFYPNIKIPVFHFLGKISYSIYLIHPIIGAAVINILSRHVHTDFQKFSIILLGVGVTLISSYIMYLFIENPSKKLSSKIKL